MGTFFSLLLSPICLTRFHSTIAVSTLIASAKSLQKTTRKSTPTSSASAIASAGTLSSPSYSEVATAKLSPSRARPAACLALPGLKSIATSRARPSARPSRGLAAFPNMSSKAYHPSSRSSTPAFLRRQTHYHLLLLHSCILSSHSGSKLTAAQGTVIRTPTYLLIEDIGHQTEHEGEHRQGKHVGLSD